MDRHTQSTTPYAESISSMTRTTVGGRQLRYEIRIIQQPERARACGAGAKASADRRPIDPPCILAVNIHDVTAPHAEQDITLQYGGTFFIYVSLASNRRTANARGMPPVNNDDPKRDVLAGSNIAPSAAYEKPQPALYFIFPDLSVRHEGCYHLTFALYEIVKSPEDATLGDAITTSPVCAVIRMHIKSKEFNVYSAKKFPGLQVSSDLSRSLAEQGSRIRIRKDIRQRGANPKDSGKDWRSADTDAAHSHRQDMYSQSRHPSDALQRPESASSRGGGSNNQPSIADTSSRRASMNDFNQSYLMPQQNAFPHPSATYSSMQSHPYSQQSFMHPPPASQYSVQPYQTQSGAPQQQQQQQQNQTSQQQQHYYSYASAHPPPHAPQQQQQQQTQQPSQQIQYPPISTTFDSNAFAPRSSSDYASTPADTRRTPVQQAMQPLSVYPQSQTVGYTQQTSLYSADTLNQAQATTPALQSQQTGAADNFSITRTSTAADVKPLTRTTTPNPPGLNNKSYYQTKLPPLTTSISSYDDKIEASPSANVAVSAFSGSLHTPTESNKRPYGSTFATSWQDAANKQGARPGDNIYHNPAMSFAAEDPGSATDSMEPFSTTVTYRRAGGATARRTHI